jgi:cytochrome c
MTETPGVAWQGVDNMIRSVFSLAAAGLVLVVAGAASAQSADVAKGKAIFDQQCKLCHSTVAGQEINAPSLYGVVGRKAAGDPSFQSYSAALKASKLVWTPPNLNKFLAGPAQMVPGTAMPITLSSPADRTNVIAYLATLKKGK